MSFPIAHGYRIDERFYDQAERQIRSKFFHIDIRLTYDEYREAVNDLHTIASDYWFAVWPQPIRPKGEIETCRFGFISDTDAMACKLRWVE